MNKELDNAKQEEQQQKEIITTKLVIIVKIAVLVLWI